MPTLKATRTQPATSRARTAERTRIATERAAKRANRRRAWPRWTERALRIGLVALPALLVVGTGLVMWRTGRIAAIADRIDRAVIDATAQAGLVVRDVAVEGRTETGRATILATLDVKLGSPIMAVDLDRSRALLERLPWVATALVERRLPGTIYVKLIERQPMALWQNRDKLVLIDAHGTVLTDHDLGRFSKLPMLVGSDAPQHANDILSVLAEVPAIARRVSSASRVGGRRWNLTLDNGIVVRLPEGDIGAALRQLAVLDAKSQLFERDVVAIDLRLPDRLVVQTGPAATQLRHLPQVKS